MSHDVSSSNWIGKTVAKVLKATHANGCCKSLLIAFTDGTEVQLTGCDEFISWATIDPTQGVAPKPAPTPSDPASAIPPGMTLQQWRKDRAARDPEFARLLKAEEKAYWRKLEARAVRLYGRAALRAIREVEMGKVGKIWGTLVVTCDQLALRILPHKQKPPAPAASAALDKILAIRVKAAKLRDLHAECPVQPIFRSK